MAGPLPTGPGDAGVTREEQGCVVVAHMAELSPLVDKLSSLDGVVLFGTQQVVNTDPEPSCAVVPGSQWELVLCIKAVCDYVQYSCTTEAIHFNDTMLYQSRLYQ